MREVMLAGDWVLVDEGLQMALAGLRSGTQKRRPRQWCLEQVNSANGNPESRRLRICTEYKWHVARMRKL